MTRRALPSALAAFIASALLMACAAPPDPQQLTAVDQLISATDAASLALRELDRGRYERADSLFSAQDSALRARFTAPLRPDTARPLANQWIALRNAVAMGGNHERVLNELLTSAERLRALRSDIANGAIARKQAAPFIAAEQKRHTALIEGAHAVLDNYRILQRAWDRRDTVLTLLATHHQL
jgi:hypothetical protein